MRETREIHTKVVGVTMKNDQDERIQNILEGIACYCEEGDEICLEHESDNEHDENAIKVFYNCDHIGYIKRELAKELAPLVDDERVEAELCQITGGDEKTYGCNILIRVLPVCSTRNASTEDNRPKTSHPKIEIADEAHLKTLSNKEFVPWANNFIAWSKTVLEPEGDGVPDVAFAGDVRTQLNIITKEFQRRNAKKKRRNILLVSLVLLVAISYIFGDKKDPAQEREEAIIRCSMMAVEDYAPNVEFEVLYDRWMVTENPDNTITASTPAGYINGQRANIFVMLTEKDGEFIPYFVKAGTTEYLNLSDFYAKIPNK